MEKAIKLNSDTVKEVIDSLCIALHNNRAISFNSNEIAGKQTGKIKSMDMLHFTIIGSDWKWEHSEITDMKLN